MAKVSMSTCCGCVELRVGCFIIAYLGIIGGGISVVQDVIHLLRYPGNSGHINSDLSEHRETTIEDSATVAYITLASHIFSLILSFVLLIGLHENKPGFLKFYLISNFVYFLLSVVFIVIAFFSDMVFVVLFMFMIFCAIWIYLMLVIASYYYKMLENRNKVFENATSTNYSQEQILI